MLRALVKSKIQRVIITDKNLRYEGSLGLDSGLLRAANLLPGEVVQVVNVNNGSRFETYVIGEPAGSGACVLNGAAARLGELGDELIVMSIAYLDTTSESRQFILVNVDKNNRILNDGDSPCRR